jgi:hypothetical protein
MEKMQERVLEVLERITKLCADDEGYAESFSIELDVMLDRINFDDGFGTEGQSDPRGDFRNGAWSMDRVEGIDGGF